MRGQGGGGAVRGDSPTSKNRGVVTAGRSDVGRPTGRGRQPQEIAACGCPGSRGHVAVPGCGMASSRLGAEVGGIHDDTAGVQDVEPDPVGRGREGIGEARAVEAAISVGTEGPNGRQIAPDPGRQGGHGRGHGRRQECA